ERERAELRQRLSQAVQERSVREAAELAAAGQADSLGARAAAQARATAQAAEALERARRRVAELKEQETHGRAARRRAEEALAQVPAPRDALAELQRERVRLAPAAQALREWRVRVGVRRTGHRPAVVAPAWCAATTGG